MKQKIFIAAEIFPPAVGGPATYTVSLANALQKRDFQVRILCYGQPDKSVLNKDIKINFVSNKWPVLIKYFLYTKKLFWYSLGYKTIYAMGPVAAGWPAGCVKKLTGKRLIVKVVGDYAWEQAMNTGKTKLLIDEFQNRKFSNKIGKLQKIERKVCQTADAVITPSEYLKKIVKNWNVDENKIKVIYNSFSFCHSDRSHPRGDGVEESLKHQKKKGLIISAGRLVSWKGFDLLIEVVDELIKEGLNLELKILFGKGPLHQQFKNKIKRIKESGNNKIDLDQKIHEEFLKELQSAEMFVLNTAYEGHSHVILEAMGVGTPVITTKVGGNPELIEHNVNGILVEYNNEQQLKDAILKLHNNVELRNKFVENSKKVLEKFTFERMIEKTVKLITLSEKNKFKNP
ncbi:glycosyltransferase family 4 protein [Patescibacteria group bacterium]